MWLSCIGIEVNSSVKRVLGSLGSYCEKPPGALLHPDPNLREFGDVQLRASEFGIEGLGFRV